MEAKKRVDEFAERLVEESGSDLHLKAGAPPSPRLKGALAHLEGYSGLRPEDTEGILREMIRRA